MIVLRSNLKQKLINYTPSLIFKRFVHFCNKVESWYKFITTGLRNKALNVDKNLESQHHCLLPQVALNLKNNLYF